MSDMTAGWDIMGCLFTVIALLVLVAIFGGGVLCGHFFW
jgi:hypothetical protein